jgi:hypothetical protein
MSTDSRLSRRLHVTAHLSGEVRVDPPLESPAMAVAGARATTRVERRRRSRAAGSSIHIAPRSEILIPAP